VADFAGRRKSHTGPPGGNLPPSGSRGPVCSARGSANGIRRNRSVHERRLRVFSIPLTQEVPVARDEKQELLRRIPLFNGFNGRQIERLGMLADEVFVPEGKVLMRQGDSGSDMMVIVTGQVSVDRDGTRVNTLGPGDFFGEIALVDDAPRTATVTTIGPARLLVVGHREFHSMMEEFPEIAAQVMHALANRIRTLEPDAAH
jgi:CRP/FNR family transcriptional regulator, cyclic AMP receptor protein